MKYLNKAWHKKLTEIKRIFYKYNVNAIKLINNKKNKMNNKNVSVSVKKVHQENRNSQ